MLEAGQMFYIFKDLLAVSSTSNAKGLVAVRYNTFLIHTLRVYPINTVWANTWSNEEHDMHNSVSIARKTFAPGDDRLPNVYQRFSVKKHFSIYNRNNGHYAQTAPSEFPIDRIVSEEGWKNKLRFQDYWYEYFLKHSSLVPAAYLRQLFKHCYWKKTPHSHDWQKN